jgi:hypothetical protein
LREYILLPRQRPMLLFELFHQRSWKGQQKWFRWFELKIRLTLQWDLPEKVVH